MFNKRQWGASMSSYVIRMSRLPDHVGLGRSTIYEMIKAGDFPAPVSLGARAVGWLSDEVDAWIESRAAKRQSLSSDAPVKEGV